MTDTLNTSSNVEKLIEKLRQDGVKAGEEQARMVLADAETRARELVAQAEEQARELVAKARAEIDKEREGTKDALQLAFRDAILQLREGITSHFRDQVKRLVVADLSDRDFLREVILALAGRAAPPANEKIEILLSREWFGTDAPAGSAKGNGAADPFILGITVDMLRNGVELKPSTRTEAGIRVKFSGSDLEVDLTDQAIAALILQHLTPRFSEIIQGARH
jgi:V/A-type H+-transporting ATPase subunit E